MTERAARDNVSANIKRLLGDRGWKTSHLVDAVVDDADVSQNTIYCIVRGETSGKVSVLASIAEVLGVTIDYLITDPASHEQKRAKRRPTARMAS